MSISLDRARELVSFDPSTGAFVWRINRHGAARAGDPASHEGPHGYYRISLDGHRYPAHRVAWLLATGAWPVGEIDHIDGNRANNAIENLRDVSRDENMKNKKTYKNCPSGHTGIRRYGESKKWQVYIKTTYLGSFATLAEAVSVRLSEEARLGFHENHGRP